MELINKHIKELKNLCVRHNVAEMYVFGSILTDRFLDNSDIDFLVKFSDVEPIEYFDNYMDFKETLQNLFSRNIDLVEIQTVKNPILKRSIDRNKTILYDRRENSKMAV